MHRVNPQLAWIDDGNDITCLNLSARAAKPVVLREVTAEVFRLVAAGDDLSQEPEVAHLLSALEEHNILIPASSP